jgi:hypothetical protein
LSPGTIGGVKSNISATYSCVELDAIPIPPATPPAWFGVGSIWLDPKFFDGAARDLTLQSTSPCIDAADDTDLLRDLADLDGDGDTGIGGEFTPLDMGEKTREVDTSVPDTGVDGGNIVGDVTDMGAFEVQGQ